MARKQREGERAFEQYKEEHPDQYTLFRLKLLLLSENVCKIQDLGQHEREKFFDLHIDKEEARKERDCEKDPKGLKYINLDS